jgi:integrase
VFHAALKKAGPSQIRLHDLRHTAATQALMKGVHRKVVSDMLGHGSVGLSLDTYSFVSGNGVALGVSKARAHGSRTHQ